MIAFLALSACGGVGGSGSAQERLPDESLVAFEASWLCQVQRHSFTDLGDMTDLRDNLLTDAGLNPADYDEFRSSLDVEPAWRAEVLGAFEASC